MKKYTRDKEKIKRDIGVYIGEQVPTNEVIWRGICGVSSSTDLAIVLGPCARRTNGDVCSAYVLSPFVITQNGRTRLHPDDAKLGSLPFSECKWRCDGSIACELEVGRPRKRRYFTKIK